MLVIPFRVKNPTKRIPIATIVLLAAYLVFYASTSSNLLYIRPDMLHNWSYSLGLSASLKYNLRFFMAIFLHADFIHLLGSMLFLWIFGPSVEERLGIPRFLLIYFLSGIVCAFFQSGFDVAFTGWFRPWIGATACIAGILGAYWYIFSWSLIDVFYWFGFWYGVAEVTAIWVISFYLLLDILEGALFSTVTVGHGIKWAVLGGASNISHIAAAATAIILCMVIRVKRDTPAISEAKALKVDVQDLSELPLHALQTMIEDDPEDVHLIRAAFDVSLRTGEIGTMNQIMKIAGAKLIDKDALLVAQYLLDLRSSPDIYRTIHLLRLAGNLERLNQTNRAIAIYRIITDRHPTHPDAETALYRMALCTYNSLGDAATARKILHAMQQRFPKGEMAHYGETLLRKLGG